MNQIERNESENRAIILPQWRSPSGSVPQLSKSLCTGHREQISGTTKLKRSPQNHTAALLPSLQDYVKPQANRSASPSGVCSTRFAGSGRLRRILRRSLHSGTSREGHGHTPPGPAEGWPRLKQSRQQAFSRSAPETVLETETAATGLSESTLTNSTCTLPVTSFPV